MDIKSFGMRLKSAREMRGLTQEELVARLGKKTIASISEYEHGKRRLAAIELPDYAEALGVPITYFFEDVIPADQLEIAVVEWFRTLPGPDAKRKMFVAMKEMAPIIIGTGAGYHPPPPIERNLNEPRAPFKKRKG